MSPHPIRVTAVDDLRRSRLTVFFRLLLAIPHFFWLGLWTIGAVFAVIAGWFAALVKGQLPNGLHRFLAAYIRYTLHVNAYLFLAANPFPPFLVEAGTYPVDVKFDPPVRQSRWSIGFRMFLAIPALILASAFVGAAGNFGGGRVGYYSVAAGGIASTLSILAWFACLALGQMPRGMRDAQLYALRYVTQVDAYIFLVSPSYPDSNPEPAIVEPAPRGPVWLRYEEEELRRSRLTVLFRLLLALPHIVWISLWGAIVLVTAVVSWVVTLVRGTPPQALHRFHGAFLRYGTHFSAFLYLVSNPFPGFTGARDRYPVDLELPGPERQRRWVTAFRLVLAFPALLISSALANLLAFVGLLGWFYALVTGRMPRGLRNAGVYAMRYSGQLGAYMLLVTDAYPFSGPWQAARTPEPEPVDAD